MSSSSIVERTSDDGDRSQHEEINQRLNSFVAVDQTQTSTKLSQLVPDHQTFFKAAVSLKNQVNYSTLIITKEISFYRLFPSPNGKNTLYLLASITLKDVPRM